MDSNVHANLGVSVATLLAMGAIDGPQEPIPTLVLRPRDRRRGEPEAMQTRHAGNTGDALRPVGTRWQEILPGDPTDRRSKATLCTYEVVAHREDSWWGTVSEVVRCVKREKVAPAKGGDHAQEFARPQVLREGQADQR